MVIQNQQKKTGLILGASSGVGFALVDTLHKEFELLTISRRGTSSSAILPEKNFVCDITDYKKLISILKLIQSEHNLSFIINCVGVGFYAPLNKDCSDEWSRIINTNLIGLINLISCIQEIELKCRDFIHIGSMAALRPSNTPGNEVYSSTKSAANPLIKSFRKSLREKANYMKVMQIHPGFIEATDFGKNYFKSSPDEKIDLFQSFVPLNSQHVADMVHTLLKLPDTVELIDSSFISIYQPN